MRSFTGKGIHNRRFTLSPFQQSARKARYKSITDSLLGLVKFCRSEEKIDVRSWKDEIYAICRHGKSAHYALWKVWDLLTSCAALLKIRALDRPAHFIVSDPEDLQDIRGQLIFVKCGGEVWTHSFSSDDSNAL